ncbi:MAG TPA: cupin domain-containing protein [Candidatus Limnocylindria bacterium]|nr:cupin domain-containing protein [Candidatus Limnocylindria bacterium]
MAHFETTSLPLQADARAPDGSEVRLLLRLRGGSLAHFQLAPGEVSVAVRHRTVEEIWFFLAGQGDMWRRLEGSEEVVGVEAGTCLTIPVGTDFQFRSCGHEALQAIGVTMPPWPGEGEAALIEGVWPATVPPGPA